MCERGELNGGGMVAVEEHAIERFLLRASGTLNDPNRTCPSIARINQEAFDVFAMHQFDKRKNALLIYRALSKETRKNVLGKVFALSVLDVVNKNHRTERPQD